MVGDDTDLNLLFAIISVPILVFMCLFIRGLDVKQGLLCIIAAGILYRIEAEYFFYVALHIYALAFVLVIVAIGTYYITSRGYFISFNNKVIQSCSIESWIFYSLVNTVCLPIVIPLYVVGYRQLKRKHKNDLSC